MRKDSISRSLARPQRTFSKLAEDPKANESEASLESAVGRARPMGMLALGGYIATHPQCWAQTRAEDEASPACMCVCVCVCVRTIP